MKNSSWDAPEPERGAPDLATVGPEGVVGIALMVGILAVMGLGVFYRYVLNDSLGWSEELSRYGLVYATFIGCATAARHGTHIRVSVLEHWLPERAAAVLRMVQEIATLVFVGYIAVKAVEISGILHKTPSAAMQLPMSTVYAAIVLGFGLAAVRHAIRIAGGWRRR